jgi:HD superfamily phosphohydrolase
VISLPEFKKVVDVWVEDQLGPYISRLNHHGPRVALKHREFNDPVWGTISINPFESYLVDNPLFQRLRHIRQLGVVHLVYPAAHHTRFEHSLGVLHIAELLLHSLERTSSTTFTQMLRTVMRSSAICHDLGHGPFSHVSESYLMHDPEIEKLCIAFGESEGREKIPFAEAVSISILDSKQTRLLFKLAAKHCGQGMDGEVILENVRNCLLGKIFDKDYPIFHELISGPFDADKLDYMKRDSFMAGVPCLLDVVRLISKTRLEKFSHDELKGIAISDFAKSNSINIQCVADSGSRALDELLIGRILLVDKVYRHQRVRSFEGLVYHLLDSYFLSIAGATNTRDRIASIFSKTDGDFFDTQNHSVEMSSSWKEHLEMRSRFKNRSGYIRVFGVIKTLDPQDDFVQQKIKRRLSEEQKAGINAFLFALHRIRKHKFLEDLGQLCVEAIDCLGASVKTRTASDLPMLRRLWADPPDERKHAEKVNRAWVLYSPKEIHSYSEVGTEAPRWATSYLQRKDIGYVFADSEIADIACLAIERILGEKFGVKPDFSVVELIGPLQKVPEIRDKLIQKGYFKNVQFRHRRYPSKIEEILDSGNLAPVAERFQGYNGPKLPKDSFESSAGGIEVRIASWLAQFEDERSIKCALDCVNAVRLIDRSTINSAVINFKQRHPEFSNATLVAMGSPEDGANLVAYLAKDVGNNVDSLKSAISIGKPILFVDDFIGLGNTADNLLSSLVGSVPSDDLEQKKWEQLTDEEITRFRNLKCGFAFASGWKDGAMLLKNVTTNIGLDAEIYIHIDDDSLPTLDTAISNPSDRIFFQKRVRSIGSSILSDRDWAKAKLAKRTMGYGNRGLLLITMFNTPTQTITCLWRKGNYRGLQWTPLFPRREK